MNSYKKILKPEMSTLKKYINFNNLCGFGNFTVENLLIGIGSSLDDDSLQSYLQIITEEFSDEL